MNDDRGMKKWLPYQSLVEQSVYLKKMRYEKNKIPRPLISSDRAEEINRLLVEYHQQEVVAKYFEDGYLHFLRDVITRIDKDNRFIAISGKRIPFRDLIDLYPA